MDYHLKATQLTITDEMRAYVEKKIEQVENLMVHFGPSVELWVELEMTSKHHKTGDIYRAEFQLAIPKHRIVAESVGGTIFEAIDLAKDHFQDEVRRFKEMSVDERRHAQRPDKQV